MINICSGLGALEDGRLVHEQLGALKEGRCAHDSIIESEWDSDVFVGSNWLTCMQNVGAWRMLGEFSTSCQLEM